MENQIAPLNSLQMLFQDILQNYHLARENEPFGANNSLWHKFEELVQLLNQTEQIRAHPTIKIKWSVGMGNWARVPWIAFLDNRETNTTQSGIYGVFLFREDMSGVYITYNQGVTTVLNELGTTNGRERLRSKAEELREKSHLLSEKGFRLDNNIDLRVQHGGLGFNYQVSTIAYKLYEKDIVPNDKTILDDIEVVLKEYDMYLSNIEHPNPEPGETAINETSLNTQEAFDQLLNYIQASGFVFEPWQVASYVTALRTKPFVILAGISGTGKSKLPALVARGTGGQPNLISVKPDWTDSSDILGFVNLQDEFQPGMLLRLAKKAQQPENQDIHYVVIIDEMNIARVEHYFAEVLSQIENRTPNLNGGFTSEPLIVQNIKRPEDQEWSQVCLPSNLAIIGTVNMDESTHGFSKKVLDRAFTIEISDIDLSQWEITSNDFNNEINNWPIKNWQPRAIQLSKLDVEGPEEKQQINSFIEKLTDVNKFLKPAQLQVGYRTRDEIILYAVHAKEIKTYFVTKEGIDVDPFDLAILMKILPRIVGGSNTIRQVIADLLAWAYDDNQNLNEDKAEEICEKWVNLSRPSFLLEANYPRTAARLCLMWERLKIEGFTTYWL
jgi:hypothetical protein